MAQESTSPVAAAVESQVGTYPRSSAGKDDDDQYAVYTAFNSGQNVLASALQVSSIGAATALLPGSVDPSAVNALMWPMTISEDACDAPALGVPGFVSVRL
jgi:hypothetical protein